MSWDNFAGDVKGRDAAGRRKGCTVGQLLKAIGPEAATKVSAVMDDMSISSRAIRLALVERVELDVPSIWTINRHRRNDCACQWE